MGTGLNVSQGQRLVGLGLILATGLLHLVEAPEYYAEVKYVGALFVANMVGSAVAAYGMWRNERWGWVLGLAVAGPPPMVYGPREGTSRGPSPRVRSLSAERI